MPTIRLIFLCVILASFFGMVYYMLDQTEEVAETPKFLEGLPASHAEWEEFSPASKAFVARFPSEPERQVQRVDERKHLYETYEAEGQEGALFSVSVITYPDVKILPAASSRLNAVMEQMMSSEPSNVLRGVGEAKFRELQALNFSIQGAGRRGLYTAFLAGNSTYLLAYTAPLSDYRESEFHYFISQFHLNGFAP